VRRLSPQASLNCSCDQFLAMRNFLTMFELIFMRVFLARSFLGFGIYTSHYRREYKAMSTTCGRQLGDKACFEWLAVAPPMPEY